MPWAKLHTLKRWRHNHHHISIDTRTSLNITECRVIVDSLRLLSLWYVRERLTFRCDNVKSTLLLDGWRVYCVRIYLRKDTYAQTQYSQKVHVTITLSVESTRRATFTQHIPSHLISSLYCAFNPVRYDRVLQLMLWEYVLSLTQPLRPRINDVL